MAKKPPPKLTTTSLCGRKIRVGGGVVRCFLSWRGLQGEIDWLSIFCPAGIPLFQTSALLQAILGGIRGYAEHSHTTHQTGSNTHKTPVMIIIIMNNKLITTIKFGETWSCKREERSSFSVSSCYFLINDVINFLLSGMLLTETRSWSPSMTPGMNYHSTRIPHPGSSTGSCASASACAGGPN